jgi:hypothetical protein
MNWQPNVFVAGFLLAIQGVAAQTAAPNPDPKARIMSGKVQYESFADMVKDAKDAHATAIAAVATAVVLEDKNKKLEAENAKLRASVPPKWKVVFGPKDWTKEGGDACNPKAGCTLEGALPHTGWSAEAQAEALKVVRTTAPELSTIAQGWKGWMTFGQKSPTIWLQATAAWGGKIHPAHKWTFELGDIRYTIIRPFVCKNWGGSVEKIEKPIPVIALAREPVAPVIVGERPTTTRVRPPLPIIDCED